MHAGSQILFERPALLGLMLTGARLRRLLDRCMSVLGRRGMSSKSRR